MAERVITSAPSFKMAESKTIPKEIDKKIGADAEKRWLDYEQRKNEKEKLRKEHGSEKLARDPDGNYVPLNITEDGKKVSEEKAINFRKETYKEFTKIIKDPKTEKVTKE